MCTLISDWIKLRRTRAIRGSQASLAAKQICLRPIKRATWQSLLLKVECRTTLYFLQQVATPSFVARKVGFVGGNTSHIAIQLRPSPIVELFTSHGTNYTWWGKFMKSSTSGSLKFVWMSLDRPTRSIRLLQTDRRRSSPGLTSIFTCDELNW